MAFPLQLPDIHAIAISVQQQPWFHTDPNPHKTNRRQQSSHPDHDSEFYHQTNRSTLSLRSLGGARLRRKVSAWSMRSSRTRTERTGTRDTDVVVGRTASGGTGTGSESSGGTVGGVERRWGFRGSGGRIWRRVRRV